MRKLLSTSKSTLAKVWKDPVGAGLIGTGITGLLTLLWNKIDNKSFTLFIDLTGSFFSHKTPIWVTLLFGIFIFILTWLVFRKNLKLNKLQLEETKSLIDAEFSNRIANLEKSLVSRINNQSSLKSVELDILKLNTKFTKHLITSYDFYDAKPNANIEHMFLCDLLDSALLIDKESYYTNEIEDVLKAIEAYLIKHPTNYTDEHERIYAAIKNVPAGKHDYYINRIKKRVE